MIIKNEEDYLPGCLDSVQDVVDEIVIVDTGSTDKSLEIAAKYGAKIFHFDWINDFAAARNYALSKSAGDWILYLDADERLTDESKNLVRNFSNDHRKLGLLCSVTSDAGHLRTKNLMKYLRFFKNSPGLKFIGRVHEQINESMAKLGYQILDSGIEILHLGYDSSENVIQSKANRNLQLLMAEYKDNPSGYNAFQIGQTYMILQQRENAVPYLQAAVNDHNLEVNHKAHAYRLLAAFYSEENQLEEAEKFISAGMALAPDLPLINLVAADVYYKKNNFQKAEMFLGRAYELNNKLVRERKSAYFDISLKPADIIMRGCQLSLYMKNKELFLYFYDESKSVSLSDDFRSFLDLIGQLFNKTHPARSLKLENLNKFFLFESFIELLNDIDSDQIKLEYLNLFESVYGNDNIYLQYLGELFISVSELSKAINIYERLISQQINNPAILFNLLSLYIQSNDLGKADTLLKKATKVFAEFPQVLQKIEVIREKIRNSN